MNSSKNMLMKKYKKDKRKREKGQKEVKEKAKFK